MEFNIFTIFIIIIFIVCLIKINSIFNTINNIIRRKKTQNVESDNNSNTEKLKEYKRIFLMNTSRTKQYLADIKRQSPLTIFLACFFVNLFIFLKYLPKNYSSIFLLTTITTLVISYFILNRVLDFKCFWFVDTKKIPFELGIFKVSHKIAKRYDILDDKDKPSILKNYFKCKHGEGYIVNKIDDTKLIIKTNMIHNNIDIVVDLVEAFNESNIKAIDLQHKYNNLKATTALKVLDEAVELVANMSITSTLIAEMKLRGITDIKTQSDEIESIIKEMIGDKNGNE